MKGVVFESFGNIDVFLNTIGSRVENYMFFGSEACDSKNNNKSFSGTESYEESLELMRKGYVDGMNKLDDTMIGAVNTRTSNDYKLLCAGIPYNSYKALRASLPL